jgi:Aerotolerance regulator N-terminal/von Willebrand factor type A domain
MGFLAPWFLAGLAAVALPVYIHLLRRQTTTPRPVSSLMFFERGTQSSTRHRRLRYLLLFVLRALLLLLLALAFANPFLRRSSAAANDRFLLVAIDNSFSMRAGTRLADAKRGALEVLATRRSSQPAQVMVLGGQLQVLTQPLKDAGALRAVVENIQAGDSHGNFGELGRGMRALAETVHTPVELHLFSDMQASNMPVNFADMVMPDNVSLVLHPIVTSVVPNWTVESVDVPGQLVDTKKARVLAVIAGHQTPAATRVVSLMINGVVAATKKIDVPADGRATVAFESLDVPYGMSRCEIRIDAADGFPGDDTSSFAVKRADPERVLFVHQASDLRSPLYFGSALAAAAQASFVLQPINVEQSADADPTKYAFVVLSDVVSIPSILENSLLQYVHTGGSVLVAAGASEAHHQRIPLFGDSGVDARFYSRSGGFSTVGRVDASHPVMKDSAGWTDAKFYYATVVKSGQSRVVARLADGTPLLMDKQMGQGHVLLFASGLDNLTNDLPLHPVFVPFVDQAARYLAGVERLSGARVVDSFVQLRSVTNETGGQGGNQGASVEIVGPDGRRPLSLQEEATAQSFQLTHAGFYQVRFANGRDVLIAVNPDRRESGLDLIPDDVLKLWSGSLGTSGDGTHTRSSAATEEKKNAYSLWWWIMLVILIAAMAESLIASRYLGTQREEV